MNTSDGIKKKPKLSFSIDKQKGTREKKEKGGERKSNKARDREKIN